MKKKEENLSRMVKRVDRERREERRGVEMELFFLCCKERKCAHQEYIYIYIQKNKN